MMTAVTLELLEKLRTFDTATICNIVELFEVRPRSAGYMDQRITAAFPELPAMVGFAATATLRASAPPRPGASPADIQQQIERFAELSGPPVVVFQDLDDPSAAATFGEVMCTTYQTFGAVGLITSGTGRDLAQVRALSFPVFSGGVCCSHGYNHLVQLHVPVHVGGLTVYPDDLLHGDGNGVTTIPVEIAAEVADIGYEYVAAEAVLLDVLRLGTASPAAYAEARREAQARLRKLRDQVTRSGTR
ncbi:MAG: dimethylmenaquinone methyltransferase [Chloroflexi bacterium]|nr:MAG: dimethylmenaquinone methyltransferase [Chloroflexota bacterium]